MMKKLLVSVLVLGIASMASASLTLNVDGGANPGDITLSPSDTIVLDVTAAAGFDLGDFQISLSNAQGSLDASGAVFSQTYNYLGVVQLPWGLPWAHVSSLLDDAQHFSLGGGNLPPTLTGYDEVVMTGLVLHLDDATDVIITLEESLGGGNFQLLDTLTVHVPEPITMGLLGVGGLFLRRRR